MYKGTQLESFIVVPNETHGILGIVDKYVVPHVALEYQKLEISRTSRLSCGSLSMFDVVLPLGGVVRSQMDQREETRFTNIKLQN